MSSSSTSFPLPAPPPARPARRRLHRLHDGSTRGGRWLSILFGLVIGLSLFFWFTTADRVESPIEVSWGPEDPAFAGAMGTLLGADFNPGNRARMLLNGDEIFPAMLADIASARHSITLETYIWESGAVSDRFIAALTDRARAGVRIDIVVDGMGTLKFSDDDWHRLTAAGVRIFKYSREHWYDIKPDANHRTHRKLMVVDGRVGYIGGICIADTWSGDGRDPDHWRDTHVRLEGPVVRQLQATFAANWLQTTGEVLIGDDWFPPIEAFSVGSPALCYKSGPGENPENARLAYLLAIASARHSIKIAHAYFVPDDLSTRMLIAARQRGVTVDVIVPARNDSAFGRCASRSRWGPLLAAGVRFHAFEPAMYHCKIMIVDDAFVTVGSVNFDNRSFAINDEANLCLLGRAAARPFLRAFADDLAASSPLTLAAYASRPWWTKAADRFCGFFRSQL